MNDIGKFLGLYHVDDSFPSSSSSTVAYICPNLDIFKLFHDTLGDLLPFKSIEENRKYVTTDYSHSVV